jgi:exopolysaccharide production protein ExoQ
MATIALLLCTAFVLILLGVEKRASRGVSLAVWIPTLWMMIAASRPLATWFTGPQWFSGAANGESGSALDRWTLIGLAVMGIVVIARRRFDWLGAMRRHGWLLALLAYMFLSTFWSEITLVAMIRWARECVAIIMALVMMSEANPRQALASLFRRSAYVLIPFSLVLIKYYPALGRRYGNYSGAEMWTGVTGQKNELGRLCMISAFFLLWALYVRWRERPRAGEGRYQARADVSIVLLGLYLLIGSSSATSLATLMVGLAIFLGLRWFQKLRFSVPQAGLLALVLFLVAYGVSVPFLAGSNLAAFTSVLGRDQTLTGRTEIWANVMPARSQQPLFGYGFGSFWTGARRQLYDIPTGHNGYLDILLETGEVGLGFVTAWLLSCARQLHRSIARDYEWASFGICLLLMGLVYNATESALNSLTDYMTAVVVLAVFVTACKPMMMDRGDSWASADGNPALMLKPRLASVRPIRLRLNRAADLLVLIPPIQ